MTNIAISIPPVEWPVLLALLLGILLGWIYGSIRAEARYWNWAVAIVKWAHKASSNEGLMREAAERVLRGDLYYGRHWVEKP